MKDRIVIGTRGSALALWQADLVAESLRETYGGADAGGLRVETKIIKTTGDKITDVALSKLGDKGLFTKELELALLDEDVDICVHSMKDLPTVLPDGLCLPVMLERADVRDVIVATGDIARACADAAGEGRSAIEAIPAGARIGTSALRRLAQLRLVRSDIEFANLRGNLDTRINKVVAGDVDAAILASAGIARMGWTEHICAYIDTADMLPAVGQGAIGIEARADDADTLGLILPLNHAATFECVGAERDVMRVLDGGCQTPFAAYARYVDDVHVASRHSASREASLDRHSASREAAAQNPTHTPDTETLRQNGSDAPAQIELRALVASVDGTRVLRASRTGHDAASIAREVSDELLAAGAAEIMEQARAVA
ncbi:MAG: hydroxymethylbilane synthase [Coriobacteriales bacterium]|jgi:hydroxymethylbilane synthase|nr:hydroxymethylbilane synthase [Coriobacteriales bacterium]